MQLTGIVGPKQFCPTYCVAVYVVIKPLSVMLILSTWYIKSFYSQGGNSPGSLAAFRAPANAIAKTMFQLAGEIDYETLFNEGDLLYNPTTHILFITFLVVMPLLFANLLVSDSSY